MKSVIYHSPLGDRELFAKAEPVGNKIDLVNAEGVLEIGSCEISGVEGGCTLTEPITKESTKKSN